MIVPRIPKALLASAFKLVPMHRRFSTAMRLSRLLAAGLDVLLFLLRRNLRLSTSREYALALVVGVLDDYKIEYTPPRVGGIDLFRERAKGRGALIVATHAHAGLARLVLSEVEASLPLVIISAAPSFPLAGTGRSTPTIAPEKTFLVAVRSRWKRGEVVGSMVDLILADGTWSTVIADPIVRLAARCGAPVFLIRARVEDARLVLQLTELAADSGENALVEKLVQSLPGVAMR